MAGFHPSITPEQLRRLDEPKRTIWQILSHDGEYSLWTVVGMSARSMWAWLTDKSYRNMVKKVWRDA